MTTILYVEDDEKLSFVTKDQLEKNNYIVDTFTNGFSALKGFKKKKYDICILDVMLPIIDGFSLAKSIRQINEEIPIIFLTARSLTEDKIEGLKLGGDDYITKPYDMEELFLKIEIFLKRKKIYNLKTYNEIIKIGDYKLNIPNQILSINSVVKKLTLKETKLLKILHENQNTVMTRKEILTELWGKDDYFLGRSLDVFISRLRKYLKKDIKISIENIRGVGFKLKTLL